MASGPRGRNMAMEFGEEFMEIHLLASGRIVKHKGMGFIRGLMVIGMKASGRSV